MFTPTQLKNRLRLQPFRPLRIVTSSGEAYEVHHPDGVLITARDLHVGTASHDDPLTYDCAARIAYLHITALEDLPAKVSKNGAKKNGKK